MKTRKKPGRDNSFLKAMFFIAPFILGLLILYIPSVFQSVRYSFSKMDESFAFNYVGFKNYNYALRTDPAFVRNILGSIGSLVSDTAVIVIYSLFVAVLLNRDMKAKGFYRTVLFLPVIISSGIIQSMQSFDATVLAGMGTVTGRVAGGLFSAAEIKEMISALSVNQAFADTVLGAVGNIYSVITGSGVQIIIFLAALQTISPSIYEAAYAEGATAWEIFWKITFPMISPMIIVIVVYTVVDFLTNANNKVMSVILDLILVKIDYGLASAMAWIYFIVIAVILSLVLFILSKFVFYENK